MQQVDNNVSCLNSRAIIEYIRRRHPQRLPELFAGMPAPWSETPEIALFLSDENNWIPSGLIVILFERARAITGNPDAAFDIGFDSILNREFSYWQKTFFKIFSSPRILLRRMNQLQNRLNNTKIVELIYDAPGRAVFRFHWREGVVRSKDLCSYNKGIYSAILKILGRAQGKVEEGVCSFSGGPYCEITLTWAISLGSLRSWLSHLFTRKSALYTALEETDHDKELLRRRFDELNQKVGEVSRLNLELTGLNVELSQKVTMLKAINTATRAIVSVANTQRVLEQTMAPIVDVFGFDRAVIMLLNETGTQLEYRYSVGDPEANEKLKDYRIPLTRDQNLMVRVLKNKKPILIRDVEAAGLNPTNRILADFRPSSFIVCPLIADDRVIGILGTDRRGEHKRPTESDLELLSIFANNIATAFLRARLDEAKARVDEELKSSWWSAMLSLVQAIEKKDEYTRGHSERVAAMAVQVARTLGLPESEMQYLHFGSILHDVGKIGIADGILRKSKPLTESEYRRIQEHPQNGEKILHPITYIRDHIYLIRNHHERWDGTGYPDRLCGNAIPLGSQIVAIADAFDAMTSLRRYRPLRPHEEAVRELKKNAGVQFSTQMVEAFLESMKSFSSIDNLRSATNT